MMTKLKPEVKEKFVAALRSGEYEQGGGGLKRTPLKGPDKGRTYHCCLGVLCELAVADGLDIELGEHYGSSTFDGMQSLAPTSVLEWANLNQMQQSNLAHKNDMGQTFEQIADYIEKVL